MKKKINLIFIFFLFEKKGVDADSDIIMLLIKHDIFMYN